MSRESLPRVVLILGGLAFLAFAYPGLLTLDSVDQLTEARAGFYTDAHPPAMAALWRIADAIIAGPFLMLVLQGTTFLAGAYLVLKRALSPLAAAIAASLLLLYPPIANPMAFIWKDSLMAGLTLLGAGLVMSPCRRARVASLPVFALATAVKYNAFAATFPLIVLLFEYAPGARPLKRYAISAAAWLGITVAAMGANSILVDQPMHYWHSTVAVADIVGVIAYDDFTDEELKRDLAGTGLLIDRDIAEHARTVYATREVLKLIVGEQRMWDLPASGTAPAPEAQRDAIAAAWRRFVFGHPGAYLRHRFDRFLDVTGVTYKSSAAVPRRVMRHSGFLTNLGLSTETAHYQKVWSKAYRWVWEHTPLYRQWIYIVLAVVLLGFCRRHRDIAALLASGILAEASLFFLAPSPDYRYSHWTIVATCFAIVMLVARRAARGNQ